MDSSRAFHLSGQFKGFSLEWTVLYEHYQGHFISVDSSRAFHLSGQYLDCSLFSKQLRAYREFERQHFVLEFSNLACRHGTFFSGVAF